MARVLSGIQPSGDPHLGNYIGAMRHWVADQEENDTFFFIVDLHALTSHPSPEEVRDGTVDLAAWLIAVGLDPDRTTLWVQSHVHEHAELSWVLSNWTASGELNRMTAFKEKAAKEQEKGEIVSAGLYTYPVLQAADILLYSTDRVPVGDDQRQHLELTRDVAQRFNQRFGETFVIPEATIPHVGGRIMNLQEPDSKMSKSSGAQSGVIALADAPDVVAKKIRSAVTDSGREIKVDDEKPAITNLLEIYSTITGRPIQHLENAYEGKGYGDLKSDLADVVVAALAPIRERHAALMADPAEISRLLEIGAEKAQAIASKMLATVYERVGFLPRGRA
jgi:tryptophanyl-tRNA synthetase